MSLPEAIDMGQRIRIGQDYHFGYFAVRQALN
jgi:hypothetical protein